MSDVRAARPPTHTATSASAAGVRASLTAALAAMPTADATLNGIHKRPPRVTPPSPTLSPRIGSLVLKDAAGGASTACGDPGTGSVGASMSVTPSPHFIRSVSSPSNTHTGGAVTVAHPPASPIASASPTARRYQPVVTSPSSKHTVPKLNGTPAMPMTPLSLPATPKSPHLFSPTFHNPPGALDEVGVEPKVLVAKREELKDTLQHIDERVAETESHINELKEADTDTVMRHDNDDQGAMVAGARVTHNGAIVDEDDEPLLGTYSCPSTPSHRSLSDLDEFDPFLFIKSLPPITRLLSANAKPVLPPKSSEMADRMTLVLDLDETLVHCSIVPLPNAMMTFPVIFNNCHYEVYVRVRPHLHTFLQALKNDFEVILFTASQAIYADTLLNLLDVRRELIHYRVFRDSCVCWDGNYLKDLTILGRDLSTVAILDNSIQAFALQLDNGIPITSWYEDPDDQELIHLLPLLKRLRKQKDVRPFLREFFHLKSFVDSLGNTAAN